jgi:hypothetical protein
MGTGDFICISMTGGAPWGFRLQGGKEEQQPLQVAKVGGPREAVGCGEGGEGDENNLLMVFQVICLSSALLVNLSRMWL